MSYLWGNDFTKKYTRKEEDEMAQELVQDQENEDGLDIPEFLRRDKAKAEADRPKEDEGTVQDEA